MQHDETWRQVTWGDLATLEYGKGLRSYQEQKSTYPVYGTNGQIGWCDTALCKKPGIIIGRKGAYRGVHLSKIPFFVIDTAFYLNFLSSEVDLIWAYYQLINFDINKIDSGSAIPSTSREAFYQIPVSLPPLPTQRKIAAILSAYDDLIENNTRRIAILEEMAQSLYREWFVHFRFPGHEKNSMVESPLGRIPEGWEIARLGDMCFITMGQSPSSEFYNDKGDGLPFHQGVTNFGSRYPTDRMYCTTEGRIAQTGDILFSVRAPVGRLNIANKKIVIGRGLSAIKSKTDNQAFIFQQLKEQFQEEDSIGNGAIFKAVTKEDVHGINLVYPNQEVISLFETHIKPIFSMLETLINKNAILQRTRDLLLPKLISGELDVEALDIEVGDAEDVGMQEKVEAVVQQDEFAWG